MCYICKSFLLLQLEIIMVVKNKCPVTNSDILLILGTICLLQEKEGGAFRNQIFQKTNIRPSSLYAGLSKLELEGMVFKEVEEIKPHRYIFRPTVKGKRYNTENFPKLK